MWPKLDCSYNTKIMIDCGEHPAVTRLRNNYFSMGNASFQPAGGSHASVRCVLRSTRVLWDRRVTSSPSLSIQEAVAFLQIFSDSLLSRTSGDLRQHSCASLRAVRQAAAPPPPPSPHFSPALPNITVAHELSAELHGALSSISLFPSFSHERRSPTTGTTCSNALQQQQAWEQRVSVSTNLDICISMFSLSFACNLVGRVACRATIRRWAVGACFSSVTR